MPPIRPAIPVLLSVCLLAGMGGCDSRIPPKKAPVAAKAATLAEARRGFKTRIVRQEREGEPVQTPPANLFQVVKYDAPVGKLSAYLGVAPRDGKKHPAIIWVIGGFSNSIGDTPWRPASPENDQSAAAFRKAGIVMMYPSFRGGNDNPGFKETFYGEVDDLLAAADFLAKQDFVDPERIYLGGHSTGGTLVLLAAAVNPRFRAVFSFGPAADIGGYGDESLTFDTRNDREFDLRSPALWLDSITCRVFIFEGNSRQANIESLEYLRDHSKNRNLSFHPIPNGTHFNVLAPMTALIARRVLDDSGPTTSIAFSDADLNGLSLR